MTVKLAVEKRETVLGYTLLNMKLYKTSNTLACLPGQSNIKIAVKQSY